MSNNRKSAIGNRQFMDTVLDSQAIQKLLPHRYPFLLVDRIIELVPRERIVGIKQVSINESFFQGHFPGAPVMPGVLVVEALAQVGAVLALREIQDRDQKLVLFTGIKEARFRRPVVPGDTLVLEVTALRIGSRVQRMRGEAKVDGQLAADAEIMSIVAPREAGSVCSCPRLLIPLRFIPLRLLVRRPGLATIVWSVHTASSVMKSCSAITSGLNHTVSSMAALLLVMRRTFFRLSRSASRRRISSTKANRRRRASAQEIRSVSSLRFIAAPQAAA